MGKYIIKLGSKRPEISAKTFNDYIASNQIKTIAKRSALDAGLDEEFTPVAITTKGNTLRSTPKANPTIKKLVPRKLENVFIRAKSRSTATYERQHKNRETFQFVNRKIMASSKADRERQFKSDIQDSNDDIDIVQSVAQSSFSATATKSMMMRSANYVT